MNIQRTELNVSDARWFAPDGFCSKLTLPPGVGPAAFSLPPDRKSERRPVVTISCAAGVLVATCFAVRQKPKVVFVNSRPRPCTLHAAVHGRHCDDNNVRSGPNRWKRRVSLHCIRHVGIRFRNNISTRYTHCEFYNHDIII